MNRTLPWLPFLVTFLLSMGAFASVADEHDEHHDDDDHDGKRVVSVKAGSSGVEIKLEREDALGEDEVEMKFDFDDAKFRVKYEQESGRTETELKLTAHFDRLAEYRDGNGNGRYDAGEAIVSAWGLSKESKGTLDGRVAWKTPTVTDVTVQGAAGKKVVAPADLGTSGRFQLDFYVFGDFVDLAASSLVPTSVKIDIRIDDYPYRANDTALALFLQTVTKAEVEVDDDHEAMEGDESGVAASAHLGGHLATLAFLWKDHAEVDGVTKPVPTTTLGSKETTEVEEAETETKSAREFVLSYARGASIVHDPEAFLALHSGSPGIPAPGALVAVALVATMATLLGRRRKNVADDASA